MTVSSAPSPHLRLGEFDEAASWAISAANRPNAHVHIRAIAAHCLAAAARLEEARAMTSQIHATLPDYRVDDFLAAFRFSAPAAPLFRHEASRISV